MGSEMCIRDRDEKGDSDYTDFSTCLAGLKILARFENTWLGFLARAELRPGLSPSPCYRQFDFKRICFRRNFSPGSQMSKIIKDIIFLVFTKSVDSSFRAF